MSTMKPRESDPRVAIGAAAQRRLQIQVEDRL
jgi:hypothetical protein